MEKNRVLYPGSTGKQVHAFFEYLQTILTEIEGRSPSSAYRKANRHEADRVRELIREFQRICGVAIGAEREWTSTEIADVLEYIAKRKADLEQGEARIRANKVRRDFDYEDMEQLREQWRMFDRAKQKVEQICAGDAEVNG